MRKERMIPGTGKWKVAGLGGKKGAHDGMLDGWRGAVYRESASKSQSVGRSVP